MFILTILLSISPILFAKADFLAGEGLSDYKQFILYPHVDKGYRLVAKGKYQEAIPVWKHALNISPNNIVVTEELLKTYIKLGKLEEAKLFLSKQLQTYGPNSQWLVFKFQLAMDVMSDSEFTDLIDSDDISEDKKVELIYQFANYKFDTEEPEKALQILQKNLSIDNQAQLLHRSYGYFLLKLDRTDDIERLLTLSSFEHDGSYIAISAELLETYIAKKDVNAALHLFNQLNKQGGLTSTQKKQWAFLLELQGDSVGAEQLLLAERSDFNAQLHAISLNIETESYTTVMNQLHYTQRLISNSRQEQRYITMFNEVVNQRYQLAHHFYRYQVKFPKNHIFWLDHAVVLAGSKQSDEQIVSLLESEKHLIKKHKRLLADTYWSQGNKSLAIEKYLKLHHYYPEDSAISTQYISYLIAEKRNKQAIYELKANYPFSHYTKNESDRLKNYAINLLSALDEEQLRKVLLTKREKSHLTAKQNITFANLWAKIGYCDKAKSLFPTPLKKENLLTLAYCYQDNDSIYSYDYLIKADAMSSDTQSQISLAYLEMNQGDMDSAFVRWQKVTSEDIEPKHYLSASQVAIAKQEYKQAKIWLTTYETHQGEKTAFYWDLNAKIIATQNNPQAVLSALKHAQHIQPSDDRLIEIAKLQNKKDAAKSYQQAEISLIKQLKVTPENSDLSIKIGNLLVLQGKQEQAIPYFENSLKGQPDNYPMQQKISYLYLQTGNKKQAILWSEKVTKNIDYYITEPNNGLTVQQQKFNQKSYNTNLKRKYNFNLDFWNGKNSIPAYLPVTPSERADKYANYWNAELLTAPNMLISPIGDFIFYGRLFGQNSADTIFSSPSGIDLLGLGLKYKPLKSQGIYFIAEPQYFFDNEESELMLRASASFFATGEHSPQWHVEGKSWTEQELYIDIAYWLVSEDHNVLAKYTLGKNYKLSSNLQKAWTIKPFALAQASDNRLGFDSRLGAGVALQLWSGGSQTMAYKRKSTLEFQLDKAMNTYLDDDLGASVTMRLAW